MLKQVFEPGFIQRHALVSALPQGADLFGFLPAVEGAVLQKELDQVFEMLWGGITRAGFPTDDGLA
jgi:hypothetical protein